MITVVYHYDAIMKTEEMRLWTPDLDPKTIKEDDVVVVVFLGKYEITLEPNTNNLNGSLVEVTDPMGPASAICAMRMVSEGLTSPLFVYPIDWPKQRVDLLTVGLLAARAFWSAQFNAAEAS